MEVYELTGDQPQNRKGRFYNESQSVDVTVVSHTDKMLARVEVKTFNITNLDEHAEYIKKLENQLVRYIKLTKTSNGEKFFYAVPDLPTQQRLLHALEEKGEIALPAWNSKFGTKFGAAQFIRKP